jgi:hypothetical protein
MRSGVLLLVAAMCASAPQAFATYRSYEVKIVSGLGSRAILEMTQYHSSDFGTNRPADFSDKLKLRSRMVEVPPGATKIVRFNDATGGYWIRWCQVEPKPSAETCGIVDLVRDKPEIRLR